MLYLQLFWEFFKTGLFAIGGGMATLPFLYDMADKTGWFTRAQLADMIAVSESTPGPIGDLRRLPDRGRARRGDGDRRPHCAERHCDPHRRGFPAGVPRQ